MTDYKKAFVDTAPFIYFIEKDENNPQYYDKVKKFFSNGYEADKKICNFCNYNGRIFCISIQKQTIFIY